LDPRLLEDMTAVEVHTTIKVNAEMSDEQQKRSCTLNLLLAMLAEGRAQPMVTNCPAGCGYEQWRRLVQTYEP
jgi:hypothetical protein